MRQHLWVQCFGLNLGGRFPLVVAIALLGCLTACGGGGKKAAEAPAIYTVSATAGEGGSISPGSQRVVHGQATRFTLAADTGYSIDGVTGCNGVLTDNTYTTGAITSVCRINASFVIDSVTPPTRYTVNAVAGEGGSITPASQMVSEGETTTFTVAPEAGYTIATVTGCGGNLAETTYTTANITAACSVNATFNQQEIRGEAPDVVGALIAGIVNKEEAFFAMDSRGFFPATGHEYSPEQAPPAGLSFPYGVFDFTARTTAGGFVSVVLTYPAPLPAGVEFWEFGLPQSDVEAAWYVLPADMYEISDDRTQLTLTIFDGELGDNDWQVNGLIQVLGGPAVTQNYSVSATAGDGGSVDPANQTVNHGETTTFNVSADTGYSLVSVTGCDGTLVGNTFTTGTITAACNVTASFDLNRYNVSASAGTGGSIDPANQTVNHGETTTFTVSADAGYSIASVTGCEGNLVGNTFTTGVLTAACNVTASFGVTLSAPANLSLTTGQNALTFTWQPVVNATGYHLYYANEPDIDPANYAAFTNGVWVENIASPYTATELKGGTYYAVVTAITAEIESDASVEKHAFVAIGGLNDTGIEWCATASTSLLTCPQSGFVGQDAESGRDAEAQAGSLEKVGGGLLGFDYSKIAADGSELAIQDQTWSTTGSEVDGTHWNCVRDNVTGLIWEVKTNDGGLRDRNHTYTWYNPDATSNGGNAGTQSAADTRTYVNAVNSQRLCGARGWRVPTADELSSLIRYGRGGAIALDTAYFPVVSSAWFWTASPLVSSTSMVWQVHANGSFNSNPKGQSVRVILVRDGQ